MGIRRESWSCHLSFARRSRTSSLLLVVIVTELHERRPPKRRRPRAHATRGDSVRATEQSRAREAKMGTMPAVTLTLARVLLVASDG